MEVVEIFLEFVLVFTLKAKICIKIDEPFSKSIYLFMIYSRKCGKKFAVLNAHFINYVFDYLSRMSSTLLGHLCSLALC